MNVAHVLKARISNLRIAFKGVNHIEALQIPYGHESKHIMACADQVAALARTRDVSFFVSQRAKGNKQPYLRLNVLIRLNDAEAKSPVNNELGTALSNIYGVSGFMIKRGTNVLDIYNFLADVLLKKPILSQDLRPKGIILRIIED